MPSKAKRLTKLGAAGSAATMVLAPNTLPTSAIDVSALLLAEPKLDVFAAMPLPAAAVSELLTPARLLAASMDTLLAKGRPSPGQKAKPQATKDAVAAAHTNKLAVGAAQLGSAEEREEAMD
jgi:hypothetical protein